MRDLLSDLYIRNKTLTSLYIYNKKSKVIGVREQ